MGYQLYRMIRDGAPAAWTGPMVLVAQVIADDARDPDPGAAANGVPWSALPVAGRWVRGRWRDGLAERTGMSDRAISRALADLAAAGYEMRQPIGAGKDGRPVFAAKGHAMRFRVPPLPPRPAPQSPPDLAGFTAPHSPPDLAGFPPGLATYPPHSPPDLAGYGAQSPPDLATPSPQRPSPQEDLSPHSVFTGPSASAPGPVKTAARANARGALDGNSRSSTTREDQDHNPPAAAGRVVADVKAPPPGPPPADRPRPKITREYASLIDAQLPAGSAQARKAARLAWQLAWAQGEAVGPEIAGAWAAGAGPDITNAQEWVTALNRDKPGGIGAVLTGWAREQGYRPCAGCGVLSADGATHTTTCQAGQ